jgi:PAS domain-containing protein
VAEVEAVARKRLPRASPRPRGGALRRDGSLVHVSVYSADIESAPAGASPGCWRSTISERVRVATGAARRSEQRFQLVGARHHPTRLRLGTSRTAKAGATDSFGELFGYRSEEMPPTIGGWRERVHPHDRARVDARLEAFFDSRELEWQDTYRFQRGDGTLVARARPRPPAARTCRASRNAHGRGMVDVTHHHETEAALRRQECQAAWQASHDELTGLLNRNGLLAHALEHLVGPRAGARPTPCCTWRFDQFHPDQRLRSGTQSAMRCWSRSRATAAPPWSAPRTASAGSAAASSSRYLRRTKARTAPEQAAARLLEVLAAPTEVLGTLH